MNKEQIDFIVKDLHSRGLLLDELSDEIIDHVCSAVEDRINNGERFIEAYNKVIKSFGDDAGLQKTQQETATTIMFKSYLMVALRNHLKQRFYTSINVGGLAIGVASCLIISLFVIRELSYDRHFPNADRLYRVDNEIKFGPNHFKLASVSSGFGEHISNEFPEVEAWTRMRRQGENFIIAPDGSGDFRETNISWADSSFFKVFRIPVLEGDPNTALKELNSIAVSRSVAEKYFPGKSALGQLLTFRGAKTSMEVRAVYEDLPSNTHFHPTILVSTTGEPDAESHSLVGGTDFNLYVLLKEGADPAMLESRFLPFVNKYVAPQIGAVVGGDFTIEKFRASGQIWDYTLTAVTDIHLKSDRQSEIETNGSMAYVKLLSAIGLLILGIACVNFINLSTARSSNRAREVGVRKVMGSLRTHLVRQFLVESTVLTLAAFILSVVLAWSFLPVFNELAVQNLSLPFGDFRFYLILVGAALIIGIMAGLYPSFFLSAFKPVKVLKGNVAPGMRTGIVRSSLVVFQFMISIFLIIGTIAIQRQLNYIQNKSLGFQKDQVLVIRDAYLLTSHLKGYKEEMLRNNFVSSGTVSGFLPVSGTFRSRDIYWPEGAQHTLDQMISVMGWEVDEDYLETLGMTLVEGRDLDDHIASDSAAILLNESAVKALGFGPNPLGKKMYSIEGQNPDGTPDPTNTKAWHVIGVVKDFHFESMKDAIVPVAFFRKFSDGYIALKFDPTHTEEVLRAAEQTWKQMAPSTAFSYSFLDEDFAKMYNTEVRLGKIFATFSGLAIVIACLGLFGLTAYTAEQRTKEIGIRKVLGASVPSIVMLLSKEFGVLIIVSYVLAAPVAWYSISWWLDGYSYKTEIGVFVYVLAGFSALIVAWLTMSYQSIKAAIANPVKSLRSE